MRDKLEDFVHNKREEFDSYEPSPDVWDRIISDNKQKNGKRRSWFSIGWKVAAGIAIFIASYFYHDYMSNKTNSSTQIANNDHKVSIQDILIPEVAEAEAYYGSLVNDKMVELKQFSNIYPEIEHDVMSDLSELDSVCIDLKEDLKDNIDNEEIINAMIQNYRLKLQVLEDILDQLEKSDKTNNNENLRHEI
ncbi:MAG: hypothetical protein C0594_00045 [Marinilabiliales bacterium]|nr:MAG: hypothetical protein C0594_00045 [Marinilabiliales bacterium]